MLMRNVAHETRNGGEAFAGAFAAPVVTVTERREGGHRWWRSRVRHNGSSHARLNGGDACTRKGVSVHEGFSNANITHSNEAVLIIAVPPLPRDRRLGLRQSEPS